MGGDEAFRPGHEREPGRPPTAARGNGPSWFRLSHLLVVGLAIVLVVVIMNSGVFSGAEAGASGTGTLPAHTRTGLATTTTTTSTTTTSTTAPTTTTTPAAPLTTTPRAAAPRAPTTTRPAAPPTTSPPAPPASAPRGILPPANPPANIAPQPNFLQTCSGSGADSSGCTSEALQAIDNGRAQEGLPAMALPSNWGGLSPEQQIFVATNLERTVRGLPPLTAMASALDQAAGQAANQGIDPSPPGGFPYTRWGSNWAGAMGNPLEALYYWMYDDGPGSSNINCTASDTPGCWGHRDNVLLRLSCQECVMGTGFASAGYQGSPSITELLVDSSGQPAVDFTWQQESAYLG